MLTLYTIIHYFQSVKNTKNIILTYSSIKSPEYKHFPSLNRKPGLHSNLDSYDLKTFSRQIKHKLKALKDLHLKCFFTSSHNTI